MDEVVVVVAAVAVAAAVDAVPVVLLLQYTLLGSCTGNAAAGRQYRSSLGGVREVRLS
jgi:hypothetical protein